MNMASSTAKEIEQFLQRGATPVWKKAERQDLVASERDLQQLIAQAFVLNVAFLVNRNYIALKSEVMTYVHPGSKFFKGVDLPKVRRFFTCSFH